jgi:poly(beta-D-mannuronate) lyase
MRIQTLIIFSLIVTLIGCKGISSGEKTTVSNAEELKTAIENAQPGSEIILKNGVWKDVQIQFYGHGTANAPIVLRAETAGEVFIEGESNIEFGGEYLTVSGLHFQNGYTPTRNLIQFKMSNDTLANHCKFTNCVIESFNQMRRDKKDHWVEFFGRHNEMSNCYLAGKSNEGPTMRVDIKGNQNINNYHQIINNHFGPRPRKGGAKAETIQLGDSYSSMSPSHTTIANNLFERCNGEVEIISSKTNYNVFRNNVFYKSEGSLVTRHGNYCTIDGNYFIGDGNENVGGIRLINTGHWVVNNYFYNLKGQNFRSPLAVMNGIPKSPQNRYNQVTDVVVAHNTWINCISPWQFGVGTNISQADVLPKSEIRSATPQRMTVANNVIYNKEGDKTPIVEHDKIDGITFKSNIINNQGAAFKAQEGLDASSFELKEVGENIFTPTGIQQIPLFAGFDFETIEKDLFGNSRSSSNSIGAITKAGSDPMILDKTKYGTSWFSNEVAEVASETHAVTTAGELAAKIKAAKNGDIITLAAGDYAIAGALIINKAITIQSKDAKNRATLTYSGAAQTPLFEMHPRGMLTLENVILTGSNTQYAFASLKENMSSLYNLTVSGCEIGAFAFVLKAYKETFADAVTFKGTTLKNCKNGIQLAAETNDKGDYNTEFLTIDNCRFENIESNVIDYYRGGYDESTIGGNLLITNSWFDNCGGNERNGILLSTRGIINVNISKNTFKNNRVKLIALLWGAKNNSHSENLITGGGKIVVEENLKLKLMY